jgi:PIN like domain
MNPSPLRAFLDRSVGTKKIAKALRDRGVDVQTIHDRYGEESSTVPDVRWIADAAHDGRVLIGETSGSDTTRLSGEPCASMPHDASPSRGGVSQRSR